MNKNMAYHNTAAASATARQRRYDEKNTRRISLKLNLTTDKDILTKLDTVKSMQGYIKDLIRKDLKL